MADDNTIATDRLLTNDLPLSLEDRIIRLQHSKWLVDVEVVGDQIQFRIVSNGTVSDVQSAPLEMFNL